MKSIDLSDRRKYESDEEAISVRQRFDRRITISEEKPVKDWDLVDAFVYA